MLEKKRQKKFNQWATAKGWLVRKIRYEARSGCPDCIYIKCGIVAFIEWKKPGGLLQESQKEEIPLYDQHYMLLGIFDDPEKAKEWLELIDLQRPRILPDSWCEVFNKTKEMRVMDANGVRKTTAKL